LVARGAPHEEPVALLERAVELEPGGARGGRLHAKLAQLLAESDQLDDADWHLQLAEQLLPEQEREALCSPLARRIAQGRARAGEGSAPQDA
jgi:hypothetical protein